MEKKEINYGDYGEIGLKAGLEIHQQLNTGKLFCNCPSVLRRDGPDFQVKRKLHVVAGESGKIDPAVLHEASLDKEFIYQGYDTACLVELDEEPPHKINKEALKIALQISIFLNCKILPVTQIMRKTVIDGSNTSGFQRTVLIAQDGYVETDFGKVGIESVCLEEDSARIVDKEKGIFRLDRLGIPLVEIATKPEIKNPLQAKKVALYIGEILRSCNIKRGIGTIRQDVNLSIKSGERIELKGFQDIKNIGKAMEIEIERQRSLVKKGASKKEVRKVLPNGKSRFLRPMPGAARMYPETDLPLLRISRKMINEAKKTLPKMKQDVKEELEAEGLNREMVKLVLKENKVEEFKELLTITGEPKLAAKSLILFPKEISKKEGMPLKKIQEILTIDILAEILENFEKGRISRPDIKHILTEIVKGKKIKDVLKIEKKSFSTIEEEVLKLIKEKPGLSPNAYMGIVMKKFKGQVNPKEAMEMIKNFLG